MLGCQTFEKLGFVAHLNDVSYMRETEDKRRFGIQMCSL